MPDGLKTIAIADGSLVLKIPDGFSFEVEKNGTICIFPSDIPDLLALRFSSVTVEVKPSRKTSEIDLAANVYQRGTQQGLETMRAGGKAWYHEDKESEQDGKPIWLRFWYVGCSKNTILISICCDLSNKQHARVLEVIDIMPNLITGLKPRGEKSPLTTQESFKLDEQRTLVEEVLRTKYDTYALPKLKADLPVLQRIVDYHVFSPEQEYEWASVGVAFGDIVANELGLAWIIQCDEFGVEPALNLKDTSITLFPRSMLLKRIEQGETPDLQYLLNKLVESVEELRRGGC